MFHIPENILELYDPERYFQQFMRIQQLDSVACGNKLTQYYDWKPLEPLTMAEAEWFIKYELGMVKYDLDDSNQQAVKEHASRHPGMDYVCSYTFPNIEVRNRLSSQKEIEFYAYAKKMSEQTNAVFEKKIAETGDPDGKIALSLQYNKKSQQGDQYTLVHIYCDKDGYFSDAEIYGMMPDVAKYSLFHILGKAPVPEEVFSNWPKYLQFLIDIGYVNDFVKELNITEKK